jgi:triacylglycerol lipase
MTATDTAPLDARIDVAVDQLTGLVTLAPQLVEEVVLQTIRDTHVAVARRVFGLVPGSAPVRAVHDGAVDAVHGALLAALRRSRRAVHALARTTAPARDPDLLERRRGWRTTVAILNGILGDLLEEQGNPLAVRMAVRAGERDVPLDPGSLARAFPDASGRVAVLLHGLVESDDSWTYRSATRPDTYPVVLRRAGVTPVLLRYNSGRHISDNAASLDDLLDGLVRSWPVPVTELVLIGHSMGGLVIRGAAEHARLRSRTWPQVTSHVVTLGAPHGGAPLEKVANAGAWLLSSVPEMAPFGAILRRRSAGIKDLRHGYLAEEDWRDGDPDAWRSALGRDIDRIGEALHHVVGATLGPTDRHPLSHGLGDLLVRWGSASGSGRDWATTATVTHIGSADHFALLNHPVVADLLQRLVAEPAG